MDISVSGSGRHRRRLGKVLPAAAAGLALIGGGAFAVTSYAGESDTGRVVQPPPGAKTAEPAASSPSPSGDKKVTPRIIGGTTSAASWMVQLVYNDPAGGSYFVCGGTLVAPNKVLTAAHCLHDENGNRQDWGKYGEVAVGTSKSVTVAGNGATYIDVTRSWVRDGYDPDAITNDVALLTLAKPVAQTTLELAGEGDSALYAAGTNATVYGWGLTSSNEDTADIASQLQKVTLPLNSDDACTQNLDPYFQAGKMICAGQLGTGDDSTGKTTCPGDSGGPLVVGDKVVGIVSWGISQGKQVCNVSGTYEAFTKVSTYQSKVRPRIDDTDISRNGKADLFVRAASGGKGYVKESTGSGFATRKTLTGSWSAYNLVLQADMNRDGYQDFIIRRRSDGAVYWRHRSASSSTYTDTKIASDWATRKFVVAPGDVTGDRFPDLLSATSGGTLYLYPGKGDGTYGTRTTVGSGYQVFNSLRGKGDFTGDGRSDLIARGSGGKLYLLKGTGKASAPFETGVQVRTWDGYNAFAAPGDVTGDGKADYVARTPGGTLYLYPGTGTASSEIFATRIKIGTGYTQYNVFG
ncbi:trypsin-like serine protease [Streptomyces sp. NPDC058695]|uniref:trypsin-like serine protease n=1 Tax=Streptomyces sp. NPDC058695 TaxID=3346604 RepID=UPI0036491874